MTEKTETPVEKAKSPVVSDDERLLQFGVELEKLCDKHHIAIRLAVELAPTNPEQTTFGVKPALKFEFTDE